MKTITRYIYLLIALLAINFHSIAQISPEGVITDDDGLLSIKENPFDPQ